MKMRNLIGWTFAAALLSTGALAQDNGFSDWDEDSDGLLGNDEWDAGFEESGAFDNLDEDGDGFLNEDEFGVFEDEGVFDEGFADNEVGFDIWDSDGDGLLDQDEASEGVYNAYNDDEEEGLNETEYGAWQDDAGEAGFWDI